MHFVQTDYNWINFALYSSYKIQKVFPNLQNLNIVRRKKSTPSALKSTRSKYSKVYIGLLTTQFSHIFILINVLAASFTWIHFH